MGTATQFDERLDTYSISDRLVDRYERSIGMVVAAKTADGTLTGYDQSHPPYYQHVGRSQYGYFGSGGFWIFYGQYAFMSTALGGHRINRGDYDAYIGTRNRGQSYYGPQTGGPAHFRRGRYCDGHNAAIFLSEVSGQTGAFPGQSNQSGGL